MDVNFNGNNAVTLTTSLRSNTDCVFYGIARKHIDKTPVSGKEEDKQDHLETARGLTYLMANMETSFAKLDASLTVPGVLFCKCLALSCAVGSQMYCL
jgi:hypothetical protein